MPSDPKLMLLHAEEFRRAGIKLEGTPLISGDQHDEHVMIPLAMCHAFALELYLKFLIRVCADIEPPYIHDVKELFGMLPSDVAERIKHKWDNPKPGIAMMRANLAKATRRPHPSFDETLQQSSVAFQRLRYAYQYDRDALVWIGGDIMECARKVIIDLYPAESVEIMLPLPAGALNQDQMNSIVGMKVQHPLRQPPPAARPLPGIPPTPRNR